MSRPPPSHLLPYTTLFRSRTGPFRGAGTMRRSGQARALWLDQRALALCRPDADDRFCRVNRMSASGRQRARALRSEEHTSELQSLTNLVCRLLLEKKKIKK